MATLKGVAQKNSPIIILVRPQLPENAGAAARAMANFGLKTLRLVAPLFSPLDPKAIALAAGAESILADAKVYASMAEAIAELAYVYGTSASERHMVKRNLSVREAMNEIASFGRVGIVFGPERTGLANDEIARFRAILHIPVEAGFNSLNLAQAVAITAYEWRQAQAGYEAGYKGGLHLGKTVPASQFQLQNFLAALEHSLDACHFWRVDHKKPIMWRNLQNIFTRMDLTEQEVRTLQGMVKALGNLQGK